MQDKIRFTKQSYKRSMFLDLAVANDNSDNVSILLGNGNGAFVTPAVNFGVGDRPISVAVGDFDSNIDNSLQHQLFTNDISNTENKIQTSSCQRHFFSMTFQKTNTFL